MIDEDRVNTIVDAYIESLHAHTTPEVKDVHRMLEKNRAKGISATSRAEISNFVKEALHKKLISNHKWINNRPPFGYKIDKQRYLKIVKKDAAIVRWIFKKYLKLSSTPDVAYLLEKEKGMDWLKVRIWYILTNPIYIGIYDVSGERAYIPELQIIDEKTFLKAQQLLKHPKRGKNQMPMERKKKAIDKVFSQYFANLDEEEERKKERATEKKHVNIKRRVSCLSYEADYLSDASEEE